MSPKVCILKPSTFRDSERTWKSGHCGAVPGEGGAGPGCIRCWAGRWAPASRPQQPSACRRPRSQDEATASVPLPQGSPACLVLCLWPAPRCQGAGLAHLFNEDMLSTYDVPCALLDTRESGVKQQSHPCSDRRVKWSYGGSWQQSLSENLEAGWRLQTNETDPSTDKGLTPRR